MPLRAAGDSDPIAPFFHKPHQGDFSALSGFTTPHLRPFFRSYGLILSHFLRCYPILRTPLLFLPILSPFSRGGAQIQ